MPETSSTVTNATREQFVRFELELWKLVATRNDVEVAVTSSLSESMRLFVPFTGQNDQLYPTKSLKFHRQTIFITSSIFSVNFCFAMLIEFGKWTVRLSLRKAFSIVAQFK